MAEILRRITPFLQRFRDYLHNAWVEGLLAVLGFVSGILLARGLGPAARGQLTAAMIWPNVTCELLSFGLCHAFVYSTGAGWATPARLRRLGFRLTIFLGVPGTVVYWFLCPFLFRKQFPLDLTVPRLFSVSIPIYLLHAYLLAIYQGSGSFRRWNFDRVFSRAVWALVILLLAATSTIGIGKLLVTQFGTFVFLTTYLLVGFRTLPAEAPGAKAEPFPAILRYGFAVYASGIAFSINQKLDQLLLSLFVSPAELGQYGSATSIAMLLVLIPSAFGPVFFTKMAQTQGRTRDQLAQSRDVIRLTFAILIPAGVVLTAIAPWLARALFGEPFAEAGRLLTVLAPATMLLGIFYILSDLFRGIGRPMYSTYGAIAGTVITIAGLYVFLPKFGCWAAAWVSLAAYGSMALIEIAFLVKWRRELLLKPA